jgi:ribosomal-protein-serine acetyltransferase
VASAEQLEVPYRFTVARPQLFVDEEISLVRLNTEHAAVLHGLVQSNQGFLEETQPYLVEQFRTESSAEHTLADMESGTYRGRCAPYLVTYLGRAAGFNAIHSREKTHANMGYWLAEEFTGRGIMTRSAGRLAEYGFDELGLKAIGLHIRDNNLDSQAVAKRLGARFSHAKKEHEGNGEWQTYSVWELFK